MDNLPVRTIHGDGIVAVLEEEGVFPAGEGGDYTSNLYGNISVRGLG